MNLEHELQQALKRKVPAPGFDQRVLARIRSGDTGTVPVQPSAWSRRLLPVAASLALVFGGAYYVAHQQQRQERQAQAERAARDVMLALQIASEKVSAVQVKVQEINQHERQVQR